MEPNLKHRDWILEARPMGRTLAALALMVALGASVAPAQSASAQLAPGCHLNPASQITSCHMLYTPPPTSYSLLYSFQCSTDGDTPEAGLVRDQAGNLYGTTVYGGQFGYGTVFKLTPSGTETVLHSFAGSPSDGSYPYFATVTLDEAGNLYGTTASGGASGEGVVFKLTASGAESVLYSFTGGTDGGSPRGGVVLDNSGNLYGTTYDGGASGYGVVFKITPGGVETVLQNFLSTDGAHPDGGLIRDAAGQLFGTTAYGGSADNGTVFGVSSKGFFLLVYSFAGYPIDGALPFGTTPLAGTSDLYGTTYSGGRNGAGTVFKLTAAAQETVLLNFDGGLGGKGPYDVLVADPAGNLYGTTEYGGSAQCGYEGCGVLFELSVAGKETVLHNFNLTPTDGAYPFGGVVRDRAGNLYGTLSAGGTTGCGAVFKFTP